MFVLPTGSFRLPILEIAPIASYKDTILNDTPILYYRLDELSGTSLTSLANPTQNTATYNGSVLLNQVSGVNDSNDKSVYLDSGNSYIGCNTHPVINLDSSTEVWFKTDFLHPNAGVIICKIYDYYINIVDGRLSTYDWTSAQATYINPNTLYNDNAWHYLVITKQNGVVNGTIIYVDGREQVRTTVTKTQESDLSFGIQLFNSNPIQPFKGNLDEIAVYNYVLIPTQVENHYTNSNRSLTPISTAFNPAKRTNTPSQMPGLYLWANSSSAIKDSTGNVGTVQDLSGNYKTLTQSIIAQKPVYTPNTLNTYPVIRFDNTSQDGFNFPPLTNIRTVYWLIRREPIDTGLFLLADSSTYDFHTGDGNWFNSTYASPNIVNSNIFRVNETPTSTTGNYKVASNEYLTIALVTSGNVAASSFSYDRGTGQPRSLYGDLVELIIYTEPHSLTQVQQMEVYLRNYGHY